MLFKITHALDILRSAPSLIVKVSHEKVNLKFDNYNVGQNIRQG